MTPVLVTRQHSGVRRGIFNLGRLPRAVHVNDECLRSKQGLSCSVFKFK